MLTSARPLHLPPGIELDAALATARMQGRAALLGYLPVGYPSVAASIDALTALARICDVVEVRGIAGRATTDSYQVRGQVFGGRIPVTVTTGGFVAGLTM